MKLQKATLICLLIFILALSIISCIFLLPKAILFIPLTISLMTGLIVFTDNGFNILIKSSLSYLFIGLNDIGIRLFAEGGKHDFEGNGLIVLLLFIGLVPCFIMLLIGVFRDKDYSLWIKAFSIAIFILLICVHLILFQTLGVDQSRYR
jgi:hypothetical protein